jgi:hypothetical protein
MDFEPHKNNLEKALTIKNPLTNKNCIDKIDEKLWWDNVIPALNEISIKSADELQEPGKFYPKDTVHEVNGKVVGVKTIEELQKVMGKLDPDVLLLSTQNLGYFGFRRKLKYSEAPPTRLFGMTLVLSYWLGFLDASEDHEMHKEVLGALERIIEAYDKGKASHPKSNQSTSTTNAKT